METICLYCGSGVGSRPAYAVAARAFGRTVARRGLDLVYGGGRVGLMGLAADEALAGGARVTGVIPGGLLAREVGHEGLTELVVVDSMHERKHRMAADADGFVALPGGMGTLEELFETLTWAQLGIHARPIGLLQVEGFFDALLAHLDRAVGDGFLRPEHRQLLLVDDDVERLLDRMEAYRPVAVEGWLEPGQE